MTRKKKKKRIKAKPVNYKQEALKKLKAKYPYYVLKSNLLGSLFLVGLILTIWEINIYRVTFISVYIPLIIWVITGLLVTPIFKRIFNIYFFNPYTPKHTSILIHYLFNIISFGGILMFLFMWTNKTFNDKSKYVITLPIVSYGHLAKSRRNCGEPYAHVVYKNKEKELIFSCNTEIVKYNSVYIEVTKGLFGFEVITDKTLIKGQW